jgi:hypothetical protein
MPQLAVRRTVIRSSHHGHPGGPTSYRKAATDNRNQDTAPVNLVREVEGRPNKGLPQESAIAAPWGQSPVDTLIQALPRDLTLQRRLSGASPSSVRREGNRAVYKTNRPSRSFSFPHSD